jgi:hypothetical protein
MTCQRNENVISSGVLPLVSGTHKHTKMRVMLHIVSSDIDSKGS